jgi:hypothetical protein
MVKIKGGLPETLPLCALRYQVQDFLLSRGSGPCSHDHYFWPESLKTCQWNIELTRIIAQDFCKELAADRLRIFGATSCDVPDGILKRLVEAIPRKLEVTRREWMKGF